MRGAVKLGKLEDDQLVGDPEDSDGDLKEIMELIKQGDIENVGPNLPNGSSSQTVERDVSSLPASKARNKTSRFKINRGGASQPFERTGEDCPSIGVEPPNPVALSVTERNGNLQLEADQQAPSLPQSPIPDTPLTVVERSSPKLPSGDMPFVTESLPPIRISRKSPRPSRTATSVVRELPPASEVVRERTPMPPRTQSLAVIGSPSLKQPPPPPTTHSPTFAPPKGHNAVFPSMIVDSPDLPPPGGFIPIPSMIIDSPDIPPPKGATSMSPIIIESPDFSPPKGVYPTPTNASIIAPAAPLVIDSPSFPAGPKNSEPPRVMSSRVVERSPAGGSQQRADAPDKKISRFAAERR